MLHVHTNPLLVKACMAGRCVPSEPALITAMCYAPGSRYVPLFYDDISCLCLFNRHNADIRVFLGDLNCYIFKWHEKHRLDKIQKNFTNTSNTQPLI